MDDWTIPYLEQKLGNALLTVNATPDGRADAVKDGKFVMAEERQMTFSDFMNAARDHHNSANESVYLSYQNNNLREQAGVLEEDIKAGDEWSQQVFGGPPEAVNLWVGDHRNVSSPHMDFFENTYSVIRGQKIFTLMPPTDMWCMHKTMFPAYRHVYRKSDGWSIERVDDLMTPWIPIDPNEPDFDTYPRFSHATCLRVAVREGETLYLPSMWYHQVEQQGGPEGMTIAVNQWYDMQHNFRYVALKFMERTMKAQLGEQFFM